MLLFPDLYLTKRKWNEGRQARRKGGREGRSEGEREGGRWKNGKKERVIKGRKKINSKGTFYCLFLKMIKSL